MLRHVIWEISDQTFFNLQGGIMFKRANYVTTLIFCSVLLIHCIAAEADFLENWESSSVGSYTPSASIGGTMGTWYLEDTCSEFPECSPTPHRGEIIPGKMLKLTSAESDTDCADNIYAYIYSLSVPITANTVISFDEIGELINPQKGWSSCNTPPCGDAVYLWLEDNNGNALAYVFQRASNLSPNTNFPTYRDVFLDPDAGVYQRNLFDDFSAIPAFNPQGATVSFILFEISEHGWAAIDNIHIRQLNLPSKAIVTAPLNGALNRSINTATSWSNGGGATSYDVYFGTDSIPDDTEFQSNQAGTSYNPGTLSYSTTYYWRIDAKNTDGTTTGDVWSFTTEAAPEYPDLTISDITPSSQNVFTNQNITITVETANQGDADAVYQFDTTLYISDVPSPDWDSFGDSAEAGEQDYNFLSAGSSHSADISFTAPAVAGTYYLRAKADDFDGIDESDENNNWSLVVTITVGDASYADLTISDITPVSQNVLANQNVTVTVETANQGNADAADQFDTTLYISDIPSPDWDSFDDSAEAGEQDYDSLSAGSSHSADISFIAPAVAGTYYLRAKADDFDGIDESDENNNWGPVITLHVAPTYTISGTVTDKYTSEPLASIHIGAWNEDFEIWRGTHTDEAGHYEITNVPPGEVGVSTWVPESSPYARMGAWLYLSDDVSGVDIALPPGANLNGRVIDAETAEGIANVEVGCWNEQYSIWTSTFSDPDGSFAFTNLPPGISDVEIIADVATGYAQVEDVDIYIGEGQQISDKFIGIYRGALVSGYVKYPDGSPVVDMECFADSRINSGYVETDIDGFYQMILPPGLYGIGGDELADDHDIGMVKQSLTITDNQIGQNVPLPDLVAYDDAWGHEISGTIHNPGGFEHRGVFSILAFEAGQQIDPTSDEWYSLCIVHQLSDIPQAGPFTMDGLPPGTYDLYLILAHETVDEIECDTVVDSALGVSTGTTNVDFWYNSEGLTVAGRILNQRNEPLLFADCVLRDESGDIAGVGETDQDGLFKFYNFKPGHYDVTALKNRYEHGTFAVDIHGPAGHWKLDDNADTSTVVDSSGEGNDGMVVNDESNYSSDQHNASGKINGAFDFDGSSDLIDCGSDPSLQFERTDSFSFSFWININDLTPSTVKDIICHETNGTGYRIVQSWYGGDTKIGFILENTSNYLAVETKNGIGPGWHHVVIIYAGTSTPGGIVVYVDNQVFGLSMINSNLTSTTSATANFYIGAYRSMSSNFFNGSLDNVMVFKHLLSEREISNLYADNDPSEDVIIDIGDFEISHRHEKEGPDLNGDGLVDFADFSEIGLNWMNSGSFGADFDQDGDVDAADLSRFIEFWLYEAMWNVNE